MKFQLINKTSGLTFNQHKLKYPLRIYAGMGLYSDDRFKEAKCWPMIRHDGAICFQRKITDYDQGELYFLHRDEWEIKLTEREAEQ